MVDIIGNRTLKSQWDDTSTRFIDKVFLEFISCDDTITYYSYGEFNRMVKKAANCFLDLGIRKGEFIGLHLHNTPEYLMCFLALAQIGAVIVPMNEHFHEDECSYIIKKVNLKRIVTESRTIDIHERIKGITGIEQIIYADNDNCKYSDVCLLKKEMQSQPTDLKEDRTISSDDLCNILFTSGTTRYPKGVLYTHANFLYGGEFHVQQIGMQPGDKFITAMPCYHMDFQEMEFAPTVCVGGTLIMIEHYSASRFWKHVVKSRANFADTMSFMTRTMMLQPVQPWEKDHHLKQVYFSMGMSEEEKERFEHRFNVRLLNSYGMTETVSAVTLTPLVGTQNWPSVGRPALSYEIKIIDNSGNEVPPGTIGEICVHGIPGRSIVKGYFEDEESTAALIDSEGWLHSNDEGYMDKDGWLFFLGRRGDMIKRNGENVSAFEIECLLSSSDAIEDAAVIGVPDPMHDYAIKAFVKLLPGKTMTEREVIEFCKNNLAKYKVPSLIEFVDSFPRTSTGKIKKSLLK